MPVLMMGKYWIFSLYIIGIKFTNTNTQLSQNVERWPMLSELNFTSTLIWYPPEKLRKSICQKYTKWSTLNIQRDHFILI